MAIWSTRTVNTNREKEYVVVKHQLRDVNGLIHGVKFRGGYAVIDKNTKRYNELRKLPLLRNTPEFPIVFLKQLKFVTRSSDVRLIWGQEVYYHYIKALTEVQAKEAEVAKVEQEQAHISNSKKCNFRTHLGHLCSYEALEKSPSGYCSAHILKDPKLEEVGINIPKRISRDEKQALKDKVLKKLQSL